MDQDSKVVSMEQRREHKNKLVRKKLMKPEDRMGELELDMLRVIDMCILLENTVQYQEKLLKHILKALVASSVSVPVQDQGVARLLADLESLPPLPVRQL